MRHSPVLMGGVGIGTRWAIIEALRARMSFKYESNSTSRSKKNKNVGELSEFKLGSNCTHRIGTQHHI